MADYNNSDEKTVLASALTSAKEDATVLATHKSNLDVGAYDCLRVGSIIKNRFRLNKRLGEGGMGCVYLAEDKLKLEANSPDPYVAIKILGGDFKSHPAAFISLQRETQKSQQLAHPNIITAYDFDRDGDIIYMTMEALNGDDLDQYIYDNRDREIDTKMVSDIILSISKGLAYAHSKGVIHSDLKPANVFLSDDNVVKILDFGIARAAKGSAEKNRDSFDASTLGALTFTYASCEMLEGDDPSPCDDLYALGIIAYQLYSGHHPFNKLSASEARDKGLQPTRLKNVNRHQWQAISSALSFDRHKKITSADDFIAVFTGPSKLKWSIAILITAIIAILAYFFYHINYVVTQQVDFDSLSTEKQIEFNNQLSQAKTAKKYGDANAAIFHLNNAFNIHPYNHKVMAILESTIDLYLNKDVDNMTEQELSDYSYHIESLLQYEALTDNPELRNIKNSIDAKKGE